MAAGASRGTPIWSGPIDVRRRRRRGLTSKRAWSGVDSYFAKTLIGSDAALEAALSANAAAGLPAIDVSAP